MNSPFIIAPKTTNRVNFQCILVRNKTLLIMEWFILVLKKYAIFEGRARRKEYWMFTLFSVLISIVLSVIDVAINGPYQAGIIGNLYSLAVLVPTIAVGVRRMHDVGKSGWYLLIPIYNLVLAVTEGDHGSNEYGPDPKMESGNTNSDLLDDQMAN